MKTKAGMALVACALVMSAVAVYAADANPLAGIWATDRMGEVEVPQSGGGIFRSLAASAINGGNTTSSIGNQSGSTVFNAPQQQTGRGGGRPGGSMAGAGPGMPRPGAGPGAVAGNKNVTASDEPALTMELKVDAKGNMSGSITQINEVPVFSSKEFKVEQGKVTEKKFEFQTIEKTEKVSNTTRWVGELTDERTITVTRLTKGGNPVDGGPIVFHRTKK
jgi:hypothetical protein